MVSKRNIGRQVEDSRGRKGILRDVIEDWEDPSVLSADRVKKSVAFIGPLHGGGKEWEASSEEVTLL